MVLVFYLNCSHKVLKIVCLQEKHMPFTLVTGDEKLSLKHDSNAGRLACHTCTSALTTELFSLDRLADLHTPEYPVPRTPFKSRFFRILETCNYFGVSFVYLG